MGELRGAERAQARGPTNLYLHCVIIRDYFNQYRYLVAKIT